MNLLKLLVLLFCLSTAGIMKAEGIVTGYYFQDFEGEGPEGWESNCFIMDNEGIDGSKAYYCYSSATWSPQFITHCIEMGANPMLSFYYKATKYDEDDWEAEGEMPATTEEVIVKISVSEDNGETFEEIYVIEPGGQNKHKPSLAHALVSVDLSAYANKTCQLKFVVSSLDSGFSLYIDNISIGTKPNNDLAAVSIQGRTNIKVNAPNIYVVSITNNGALTQTNYTVRLMSEAGDELTSKPGVEIAERETKTIELEWMPDIHGPVSIYGQVFLADDEYPVNDKTPILSVSVLAEGIEPIIIGNGTENLYLPYHFFFEESVSQTLYLANDIKIIGSTIDSISYISNFGTDAMDVPIMVWIGEADFDNLEESFLDPDEMTLMFDGTIDFAKSKGGNVIVPFDNPYTYTGGNLVVHSYKGYYESAYNNFFQGTRVDGSSRSRMQEWGENYTYDTFPNIILFTKNEGTGTIKGVVTDGSNPLSGAKVGINGTQRYFITKEDGAFEIETGQGSYTLIVEKYGYYDYLSPNIQLDADEVETINIALTKIAAYSLGGTITASDTGNAVENAIITLEGYMNYEIVSGAMGKYALPEIFEGSYNVSVTSRGYEDYSGTLDISGNTTHNIAIDEILYPAFKVKATKAGENVEIEWVSPQMTTPDSFIFDDGTCESSWGLGKSQCMDRK